MKQVLHSSRQPFRIFDPTPAAHSWPYYEWDNLVVEGVRDAAPWPGRKLRS